MNFRCVRCLTLSATPKHDCPRQWPGKDARILAISDEMLKDLTSGPPVEEIKPTATALQHAADMLKQRAFDDAYRKLKNARLANDYGMSAEKLAEMYPAVAEMSRRAAETIDRVVAENYVNYHTHVLDATDDLINAEDCTDEDDDVFNPDLDDQGERQRIARSLGIYARQFHIAAMEGEDLASWLARVEKARQGMNVPQYYQMMPFISLLKVFTAAAMGIDQDELDELIQRKIAMPSVPKSQPGRTWVPSTPIYDPMAPMDPTLNPPPTNFPKAGCSGPCCAPVLHGACGGVHSPGTPCYRVAPAAQVDPVKRSALKDVDLGPLLGRQRHSAAPKDSILNPPVKGFVGSDKYGYDPDVD
jgi:hypothetical protein